MRALRLLRAVSRATPLPALHGLPGGALRNDLGALQRGALGGWHLKAAEADKPPQEAAGPETTPKAQGSSSSSSSSAADPAPKESAAEAATDSAPENAEEQGASSAESSGGSGARLKKPLHKFIEIDVLQQIALPVQTLLQKMKLLTVSLITPLDWNSSEFSEGVTQAVRAVHGLLCDQDKEQLRPLLAESLYKELTEDGSLSPELLQKWQKPPKLQAVKVQGLSAATFEQDTDGGNSGMVRVFPLVRLVEDYSTEKATYRVSRSAIWGFERHLTRDTASPWKVCNVGEKWHWEKKSEADELFEKK